MATVAKKKSTAKTPAKRTVEARLAGLEESIENLLSTVITLVKSHTESHSAFVQEISRLKDEVAALKKRK